jgi:hypothetical protein
MEPFNCIRYIEDGPVHESVTRLTTGEIMARHRSQDLHAGKVFGSQAEALDFLLAIENRLSKADCRSERGCPDPG